MNLRRVLLPGLGLLLLMAGAGLQPFLAGPKAEWLLPILGIAGWLALMGAGGRPPARQVVPGLAVLALMVLYAANPSHRWSEGLGLVPLKPVRWLPATADLPGTWQALKTGFSLWVAFLLGARLSENQIRRVGGILGLVAVASAVWVIVQRLEPRRHPIYELTAFFVNENHFAVWINLILPVTLAVAARAHFRARVEGRFSSPAGLWVLSAVILSAAIMIIRSRAGTAVLIFLWLAFGRLYQRVRNEHPFLASPAGPWRRRVGLGLLILGLTAGAMAFAKREWRPWDALRGEFRFRGTLITDTVRMWQRSPVWGVGAGAFTAVYPYYQSSALAGRTILHAHCEPVQFLAEWGIAGGGIVLLMAGLMLVAGRRPPSASPAIPAFADLERRALALALVAMALHSLLDFPFRIPLLAVLAAAWAGMWSGTRAPARPKASLPENSRQ